MGSWSCPVLTAGTGVAAMAGWISSGGTRIGNPCCAANSTRWRMAGCCGSLEFSGSLS